MSELVTEARAEYWATNKRKWLPLYKRTGTVPAVVEMGRTARALELQGHEKRPRCKACPVRVVDSTGTVVAQWGRP